MKFFQTSGEVKFAQLHRVGLMFQKLFAFFDGFSVLGTCIVNELLKDGVLLDLPGLGYLFIAIFIESIVA